MKFKELELNKNLLQNLNRLGFSEQTPIQESTIPTILEGKDLIGIAKTGSGKTLAYGIPIIERQLNEKSTTIKNLVLVPTRELAMQVRNELNNLCSDSLRVVAIIGGVAQNKQTHDLKKGCDILVATPGRLNDLINQRKVSLANTDLIVLDEADTMLDMGFIKEIEKIISKTATKRQVLMFTATMSKTIEELTTKFMNNPVKIEIEQTKDQIPQIEEELYCIDKDRKHDFILDYLSKNRVEQAIIFTKTKIGADKLCDFLNSYDLTSVAIHGDKRQSQRSHNLKDFRNKRASFLIATDIAARGIDIKGLPLVINYNLPDQPELYIHRIGRTGRAGQTGKAISIMTKTDRKELNEIERLIKRKLPLVKSEEYSTNLSTNNDSKKYFAKKNPYQKDNKFGNNKKNYGNKKKYDNNKPYSKNNDYKFSKTKRYTKTHNKINN